MLKERARAVDAGLRLVDMGAVAVAFPIAYWIRDGLLGERFAGLYPIQSYWPVLALTQLFWIGAAWVADVYQAYRTTALRVEAARIVRAMALAACGLGAVRLATSNDAVSRLFLATYAVTALGLLLANRVVLRRTAQAARRRGYNTRTYAVVGSGGPAQQIVAGVGEHPEWGCRFAGYVLENDADTSPPGPVLGRLRDLSAILESNVLDSVIFATTREHLADIEAAVLLCEEQGVGAKICLNFFPRRIARTSVEVLGETPVLAFSTVPSDPLALLLKRAFDVVVSVAVLALLAPLLVGIAIAIRAESLGPVLFRQRRVGVNGREFTLLKFRSMRIDAEQQLAALRARNEASGPVFKMRDDPRVTRVGRFLRRTSLDELPQFLNVLRGDMSVVGPRPPLPSEVKEYQRWHRRRLSIKPGITCTWQVSGRSDIAFDRWMELDLSYIDNWSLWRDLLICWKTIPAVLTGRGAR